MNRREHKNAKPSTYEPATLA